MAKKSRSPKLPPDLKLPTTLAGIDAMAFEMFELRPEIMEGARRGAARDGVTYLVCLYTAIADVYKDLGKPIPPEMREYLVEQGKGMTPEQRKRYLAPYIS